MLTFAKIAFLIAVGAALAAPQQGPDFVVIVNKKNPIEHLSPSKVKVIFLRNVSRWPWGAEIVPVDLPDKMAVRRSFLKTVMDSSPDQMQVYWIDQKVSRSLAPPVRVSGVREAKALVASQAGAVAYIPAADADDSVRVLEVK